jgi:hypothetical protein
MDSQQYCHQDECVKYEKVSLRAQALNEEGAFCIEVGNYEAAIATLSRAFHTAEECVDAENNMSSCSPLTYCSLEDCMAYSEHYYSYHSFKKQHQPVSSASCDEGFIYRNPIRVIPDASEHGHRMGMTLPMIVIFNLALAQHLKAIQEKETTKHRLQNVMQLYEMAYRWQLEEHGASLLASLRFTMVISNNLGEIHRAVNNHTKHEMCLQHLLSTMMFAVDSLHENDHSLDLDGFLRNASRLILQAHCAGAA